MRVIFYGILIAGMALASCGEDKDQKSSKGNSVSGQDTVVVKEPTIAYGFVLDSFHVIVDSVGQNQTLSHVLLPHGIDQARINKADVRSKDSLVGLDYIQVGKKYTLLFNPMDTAELQYMIYEKNTIEYVVFDFTQDVLVTREEKEVTIETKEASGVITYSLWNAFIDNGLTPDLLMRTVNIYQWSVDFFSIQPGDHYRIIYDDRSVEGVPISAGKIHALEINTYDSSYYAIPFQVDSAISYFDGEGGSLRKALLKAPLDYLRISSNFSHNRLHPVLGYYRPHLGVDYAAPTGTPVVSVGDGTVTFSGWSGGAGNLIKIKHNDRITTLYMHLSKRDVSNGERVIQGQKIGEVGSTGLSTGPHLDYRININGEYVDPVRADIPTSEPLPDSLMPQFSIVRDSLVKQLMLIALPDPPADTITRDTLEHIPH